MVDTNNQEVSISKQCKLLSISRSSYYHEGVGENESNLNLMKILDREYLQYPFMGSRQMQRHLARMGYEVSRKRIIRLMRKMGLMAIYPKPKTSAKDVSHKVYPYLLRNLEINRPNQVWSSDITYIPMKKGFMYLTAVKDWFSKKVLSWRLSNTMDTTFCVEALHEAIVKHGTPDIFNTDQGSQYTSTEFTDALKSHGIKISMDGKGRWIDNVFIERLWRSLKYECIYLQEFDSVSELKHAIQNWVYFYNNIRPHSVFGGKTPNEVYNDDIANNVIALTA